MRECPGGVIAIRHVHSLGSLRMPAGSYQGKQIPQVEELVAQYKPALLWFDVPDLTRQRSEEFLDVIRRHVPTCIINDRVGNGLGDYATPEQFIPATGSRAATGKPA